MYCWVIIWWFFNYQCWKMSIGLKQEEIFEMYLGNVWDSFWNISAGPTVCHFHLLELVKIANLKQITKQTMWKRIYFLSRNILIYKFYRTQDVLLKTDIQTQIDGCTVGSKSLRPLVKMLSNFFRKKKKISLIIIE